MSLGFHRKNMHTPHRKLKLASLFEPGILLLCGNSVNHCTAKQFGNDINKLLHLVTLQQRHNRRDVGVNEWLLTQEFTLPFQIDNHLWFLAMTFL